MFKLLKMLLTLTLAMVLFGTFALSAVAVGFGFDEHIDCNHIHGEDEMVTDGDTYPPTPCPYPSHSFVVKRIDSVSHYTWCKGCYLILGNPSEYCSFGAPQTLNYKDSAGYHLVLKSCLKFCGNTRIEQALKCTGTGCVFGF